MPHEQSTTSSFPQPAIKIKPQDWWNWVSNVILDAKHFNSGCCGWWRARVCVMIGLSHQSPFRSAISATLLMTKTCQNVFQDPRKSQMELKSKDEMCRKKQPRRKSLKGPAHILHETSTTSSSPDPAYKNKLQGRSIQTSNLILAGKHFTSGSCVLLNLRIHYSQAIDLPLATSTASS